MKLHCCQPSFRVWWFVIVSSMTCAIVANIRFGNLISSNFFAKQFGQQLKFDGKDENSNDDATILRVLSLCACYPTEKNTNIMDLISYDAVLDISLRRLATIAPAITYTGMYRIEQNGSLSPPSCEDQVEQFMSQRLSEQSLEASNTTTYLEMIYTQPCSGWYQQRPLKEEMAGKTHSLSGSLVSSGGLHIPPKRTHFQRHILDWGDISEQCKEEEVLE